MHYVRENLGVDQLHQWKLLVFQAYYENGQNISDQSCLIELAIKNGIEKSAITEFFGSSLYEEDVLNLINQAKKSRITGVPSFEVTIDGEKFKSFSGARSTSFWLKL